MACRTFTCFGKLPQELRTQICILATPPRVILLQKRAFLYYEFLQEYMEREGTEPKGKHLSRWDESEVHCTYSHNAIPALMHTCRDSRGELVKHGYELTFGTESTAPHANRCLLKEDKKRVRWVVYRDGCAQYVFTGEAFSIGGGLVPFLAPDKRSKWPGPAYSYSTPSENINIVDDAPKLSPAFTFITRRDFTPEHSHTKTTSRRWPRDAPKLLSRHATPCCFSVARPLHTPDEPLVKGDLQKFGIQPDGALTLYNVPFQNTRKAPDQNHPLQIATRTRKPDFNFELLPFHSPLLSLSRSKSLVLLPTTSHQSLAKWLRQIDRGPG
ncbi:hypothetical protein EDB82DRAFT_553894 [Fusarium venenatum]|nr:hypothetical protein EDB82DRAFT_553894 [Fusarium venenatum]